MKKDTILEHWDKAADAWVDFVRTGLDVCRDYMNNPAMFKLLGDIRGKKVLDLCCGEGYNTRIMARKGAKVTGVDFSKDLLEFARKEEKKKKLGIKYQIGDASDLWMFKNNSFDVVVCFMALQDIKDYLKAVKEAKRVLRKSGRFVFAIPHPCFEKRIINDEIVGGWVYKEGTTEIALENTLYYMIYEYFTPKEEVLPWRMKRLKKHFRTVSFHRSLTDYVDALYKAGLLISRLIEPKPTKEGIRVHPTLIENTWIPQSIAIETIKP